MDQNPCWVTFYQTDIFQEGKLTIEGPMSIAKMDSLKLDDGKKAGDQIDSLKTGPNAWLTVFRDENNRNTARSFGPNSIIYSLDDYDIGDNIDSFTLFDSEPTNWQSSVPKKRMSEEVLQVQISNTIEGFGDTVAHIALMIPKVGQALSAIISFFWPDPAKPSKLDIWYEVRDYVQDLVADLIVQQTIDDLEKQLEGLFNELNDYVHTTAPDAKKLKFESLQSLLETMSPYYMAEPKAGIAYSAASTLPYFVAMATIDLLVQRELCLFYKDIYGGPDKDHAYHLSEFNRKVAEYKEYAANARTAALSWRLSKIHVYTKDIGDVINQAVDDYTGWAGQNFSSDQTNESHADVSHRQNRMEAAYNADLDVALYAVSLWDYLNPENQKQPVQQPVFAPSGLMGSSGGQAFDDGERNTLPPTDPNNKQRITSITVHSGLQVDGIEITYADGAFGKYGTVGGTPKTLVLDPDEYIVGAYGRCGNQMDMLWFRTSKGREVGGGGIGGSTWSSTRPQATDGWLGWISGYQSSGSVLNGLMLHWVYQELL
jgi:hypothetical protein